LKNIILIFLVLVFPTTAYAEDPVLGRSHWSLELKGGTLDPDVKRFADFYGKKDMPLYAGSIAYKVLRQLEVGVGGGTAKVKGQAFAPGHQDLAGGVVYKLYPLNVFVLARGIIYENQWLVPYIGGGWTRMYYRQKIQNQGKVSGSADGYHVRGGLQFLLNNLDQSAANSMFMDYGVYHTYLFVEAEQTTAKEKTSSVDLGGTAYLIGLLLEF
jgi:hypothetical protein